MRAVTKILVGAATFVGVTIITFGGVHLQDKAGFHTFPVQMVSPDKESFQEALEFESQVDESSAFTFKEVRAFASGLGLSKPVKRIINDDNTCAGVVRADGSADGECPPEAANLPTVPYDVVMPPKNARE